MEETEIIKNERELKKEIPPSIEKRSFCIGFEEFLRIERRI